MPERPPESFLPNFCSLPAVFAVVIGAALLAFVLTLYGTYDLFNRLDRLALTALFTLWAALSCAGALCLLRRGWRRASPGVTGAGALLAIVLITWLLSELAWWVLNYQAQSAVTPFSHGQFIVRNVAIAALVGAVTLRYCYLQHAYRRRVESESEARIQALQSRIRPHFLFNSMNTIASLTRSRPDSAERAVEDLADLFRASLADARERVTLREELDLAHRYLNIEALRLGGRLQLDWQVEALPGDALVPALIVQPLLENAIYHGIEPRPEGGLVSLRGERDGEQLRLVVDNPLPPAGTAGAREGNRLAQENVRQRLAAHFGSGGSLRAETAGKSYRATLLFPYETGS